MRFFCCGPAIFLVIPSDFWDAVIVPRFSHLEVSELRPYEPPRTTFRIRLAAGSSFVFHQIRIEGRDIVVLFCLAILNPSFPSSKTSSIFRYLSNINILYFHCWFTSLCSLFPILSVPTGTLEVPPPFSPLCSRLVWDFRPLSIRHFCPFFVPPLLQNSSKIFTFPSFLHVWFLFPVSSSLHGIRQYTSLSGAPRSLSRGIFAVISRLSSEKGPSLRPGSPPLTFAPPKTGSSSNHQLVVVLVPLVPLCGNWRPCLRCPFL